MIHRSPRIAGAVIVALSLAMLATPRALRAQGILLHHVGPVNQGMGGAAVAAPIDSIGAMHWNPATLSGLSHSEVSFGIELLLPTEEVSSSVLGLGAGSTDGEPGVAPVPTVAIVHKPVDSQWTFGLGMFGVGGFRVNYPGSLTNPILTAPPSAANGGIGGLGQVFSEAEYLQIVPTVSFAVSEKLSIGFAPIVDLAKVSADPVALVPPDDANGDGFPTFPPGRATRYRFGGGFRLGVYYLADNGWHWGAAVTSPQWLEKIRINTEDEIGNPRHETVDVDLPMVVSVGAAYSGFENLVIACDLRYFDYGNTDGFGSPAGFGANGAVTGLGWESIFAIATGVQYRASDRTYLRLGYSFNENPVSEINTAFNIQAPLIVQHLASVGASYGLTNYLYATVAYTHAFENQINGPLQSPAGPVPGTTVSSEISADALSLGVTLQY